MQVKLQWNTLTMLEVIASSVVPEGTIVLWIKNLSLLVISGGDERGACIVTTVQKFKSQNQKNAWKSTTKIQKLPINTQVQQREYAILSFSTACNNIICKTYFGSPSSPFIKELKL